MTDGVRIDQWLWAARLYKTRSIARKAVDAGHVQVGGARVKPSRLVHVEDRVAVRQGHIRKEVEVTGLATKRGSATIAATLYTEQPESIKRREAEAQQHKLAALARVAPDRRPDKRDRRRLQKLKSERE